MEHPTTWFELLGADSAGLQARFGELLGWRVEKPRADLVLDDDRDTSPARALSARGSLTFYVSVPDLTAAVEHAQRLGGRLVQPIVDLPLVAFALLSDPAGHRLGLLQKLDD